MSVRTIFALPLLAACGPKEPSPTGAAVASPDTLPRVITVEEEALGGVVKVDVRCPNASLEPVCKDGAAAAIREIQRIGDIADTWNNTDGDVARINAAAGGEPVAAGEDVLRMVTAGQTVAAASQGAFDITVGALSGLWDVPGADLPDRETIQERLQYVDWTRVRVAGGEVSLEGEGMGIVLGAVVKGDAADRALAHIPQDYDVKIDVGTDYIVRGEWEVEVPLPGAMPRIATFKVRDTALVTSGTWVASSTPGEGFYKQVVDARTGAKADGAAVSVVAHPRGIIADALSTTLRVTGAETSAVEVLGGWGVSFNDS
ncbi:MAG: FAD:protein FMN transferase, partial [Myxococcota bacterium]|nr:FAD:protein FMN transferase [Myxococcota bacterium]